MDQTGGAARWPAPRWLLAFEGAASRAGGSRSGARAVPAQPDLGGLRDDAAAAGALSAGRGLRGPGVADLGPRAGPRLRPDRAERGASGRASSASSASGVRAGFREERCRPSEWFGDGYVLCAMRSRLHGRRASDRRTVTRPSPRAHARVCRLIRSAAKPHGRRPKPPEERAAGGGGGYRRRRTRRGTAAARWSTSCSPAASAPPPPAAPAACARCRRPPDLEQRVVEEADHAALVLARPRVDTAGVLGLRDLPERPRLPRRRVEAPVQLLAVVRVRRAR